MPAYVYTIQLCGDLLYLYSWSRQTTLRADIYMNTLSLRCC